MPAVIARRLVAAAAVVALVLTAATVQAAAAASSSSSTRFAPPSYPSVRQPACPADCTRCGQPMDPATRAVEASALWLLANAASTTPGPTLAKAPRAFYRALGGAVACNGETSAAVALEFGVSMAALGPALFVECAEGAGSTKAAAVARGVFSLIGQSSMNGMALRANGNDWTYSEDGSVGFPEKAFEGYLFSLIANQSDFNGIPFPRGQPTLRATLQIAWGLLRYGLDSPQFGSLPGAVTLVTGTIVTARTAARGNLVIPEAAVPLLQKHTLDRRMSGESTALLCAIANNVDPSWFSAPPPPPDEAFSPLLSDWARRWCDDTVKVAVCPYYKEQGHIPKWIAGGLNGTAITYPDPAFDVRANIIFAGILAPNNSIGAGVVQAPLCDEDPGVMGVALLRAVLVLRGINQTTEKDPFSSSYVAGENGEVDAELTLLALMAASALRPPTDGPSDRDRARIVSSLTPGAAVARACEHEDSVAPADDTLNQLATPPRSSCAATGLWGSTAATALALGSLANRNYFTPPAGPSPSPTTTTAAPPPPPPTTTAVVPDTTAAPATETATSPPSTGPQSSTPAPSTDTPPPATSTTDTSSPVTTNTGAPTTTTSAATTTEAPTTTTGAPTAPPTTTNATPCPPDHPNPEEKRDQIVIWSIVGGAVALLGGTVAGLLLRHHVKRRGERAPDASHLLQAGTQPTPIGFF